MASSSGIKLGRAYVLIDAVDRTKQACNAALRNISTLADNVMAIGTNMTIGATIAVTLDASASRAFREFEETMLKVKAKSKDTAGATVAAYDRLIEKAQQLGRVTKFTAPQIADAMAGMAAAGLSRSTIDKSIKNVLDLAVATGVEIPTASRIAMAAMQQFNMTAEQSAEICDVLSAAVNNSALNLEDIGETFKYAAPLAKEFGMDIKQLSVVIAALGNAGIKGSQAGTSLRQMMTKLSKPGSYDLEKFNKDFEANIQRDIVVNVGGVLRKRTRPILDILRDMGRAMDEFEKKHPDIDPQKKLAVFSDLFGRYAMTAGSTLSDNMKNLDTMMRAINNSSGTAGKTAQIMNSGIGGMHAAFISAWQDVAIQYGKALNDTVKTFYSAFTRIAHVVSSFIQNNKRIISIATASTAATAGLGVAMMVSAAAVKTFAVVGGTFTSVVGTMTSAAYGFAIALNGWISPLISAQGLLRGLSATDASLVIPIRSVAGVIGSFAPRWNLPWREAPAGAARLTATQARNASGLLSAYYARSLATGMPAGVLHSEIAARETARVAAIARSLTPEARLETLNDRVTNHHRRDILRRYNNSLIGYSSARDELARVSSKQYLAEQKKSMSANARGIYENERKVHSQLKDSVKKEVASLTKSENDKLKTARAAIRSQYSAQQTAAIARAASRRSMKLGILSESFDSGKFDTKAYNTLKSEISKGYRSELTSARNAISESQKASIAQAKAKKDERIVALNDAKTRAQQAQKIRREANARYATEVAAARAATNNARKNALENALIRKNTRLSVIESSDLDSSKKNALLKKARDEYNKEVARVKEETSAARKAAMTSAIASRNKTLSSVKGVEKLDPKSYAAMRKQISEDYKNEVANARSSAKSAREAAYASAIANRGARLSSLDETAKKGKIDKNLFNALKSEIDEDYKREITAAKQSASTAEKAAIANAVAQRNGAVKAGREAAKQKIAGSLKRVTDAKTAIKNSSALAETMVAQNIATAEAAVTAALNERTASTAAMRASSGRYIPMRGQRIIRPDRFFTEGMTRDFGRNNQYLRERMRMLRLAGFYDMTTHQHTLRSAEIIRTRRLMTANNMMLGRQRWGTFFRPFTDALQRATRAVGQFGMQVLSSITRLGIHPIAGARSLIANVGSMLFAGLAPGGGIMKGIGATFKFAFTYLKRGLVPVMQTLLRLAVQFATAPLTWAAGLTYATLQGGKLKEVMAGVYIAISAIGVGVSKLWVQLKNLFSWLGKSIKENMAQRNAIIDPVIDMWKGTFSRLFDDMKGSFSVITEAIGVGRWGDAFKVLGAQWRVIRAELSATLRNNWEHMKYTFMTVWNRVVDYFQNGEGLLGIIKWALTGLWGIAKWAIAGLYNVGTMLVGKALKIGQRIMLGNTAVYTSNRWSERSLKGNIFDSMRELKSRGINIDLSKYKNIQEYYNYVQHMSRADAINAVAYRRNGERRVFDTEAMNDEWEVFLQEALAAVQGTPFEDPRANGNGWLYPKQQIKEQYEKTFGKSGGLKDVSDDKEVIEAREYLDETQRESRGNVERQKAAEAAKQLKEREEGVVKELGEEGVSRIAGLLEGFYDFSDVSENRKKGLILAAGEYITEMGISIDKFAEIIDALIKLRGANSGLAKMYSEKSNIEYHANLVNDVVRAGMATLATEPFKDGIKFNLTNSKGESIEKVLGAKRDGTKLTTFERLKELGEVLATLSTEQKQNVRAQFISQYGKYATSDIENALDVIFQRNKVIDFTGEKARYAGMSNENLNNALSVLDFADQAVSDETKKKLKDTFADEFEEITPEAITKDAIYQTSFGENKVTSDTYQPEKVKDYTRLTKELQGMLNFDLVNGKTPDEIAELAMQAYQLKKSSKTGAFSTIADAAGFINDINTFNLQNSKDLDKKVKYYGGDVEGLTNMEKLSLVKEREGVAGLMKFLPKQGAMFEKSKDFANWLKAPEENKKPQVWTVVQANIKDMLSTFKAFADNRNRVILDRRAKEEKDAKAKEEEAKKARGEDIEGRLKNIESGISDLSDCVTKGDSKLKVDMGYV